MHQQHRREIQDCNESISSTDNTNSGFEVNKVNSFGPGKRGCVIATNGYTKVPNLVLDSYAQILSMPAYIIYLRLFRLSHGFQHPICRVSLRTLERSCGLAQKTVAKGLQNLLSAGFIEVSDQGNVMKATEYRVFVPAVNGAAGVVEGTAPLPDEIPQEGAVANTVIKQSSIVNTTTTNSANRLLSQIDCSPLSSIGLSEIHLNKFIKQQSVLAIQNSIDAFAFDLRVNRKSKSIKGSPLNFFIGIMMNGPYSPPENFKSRQQLAELQERERCKKVEEDKNTELRQRLEQKRLVLRKIIDCEFAKWSQRLPDEQKKSILPQLALRSEGIRQACLRNHFEEKILGVSLEAMSETQLIGLFQNVNRLMAPR